MRGSPRVLAGTCLAMLALFSGCGPAGPPAPSVSGVVTCEGEPLTDGRVTLFGAGGAVASGEIQRDGTFLVPHAPLGPVRASIVQLTRGTPFLQSTELDGDASAIRTFKNRPVARARSEEVPQQILAPRYADPERSGLSFTVVPGPQTHDFHLGAGGPLPERPPGGGSGPRLGLRMGELAPNIEGEDLDGRPFSLRAYRGQVVVLTFWGHW